MSELRWNPLLNEWVVTATHRQERPHLEKDGCPFCPSSGLVPSVYDVMIYPNDFPTFSIPPPELSIPSSALFQIGSAIGVCDVVLYHPEHSLTFAELPVEHIRKLVRLWVERFKELGRRNEIRYVFIFENKGEVIGVTMKHPHGQIYAFPFIPPVVERELAAAGEHHRKVHRCLLCDILNAEMNDGRRMVSENDSFAAFVPFFARFPYEVHVYAKRHFENMVSITQQEMDDLASILKTITMKYDGVFGFSLPYMMVMHQAPTDGRSYPQYHFHIEFYPPYRAKDKLKYAAGCESGAGTFINDTLAEDKAAELRNVMVDMNDGNNRRHD